MALLDKNAMDSKLVGKIVHEVKSQGVFDEFRRNSIADVDTKPAYQNLRQRVESTVKKFLSEQKWSPDINKIQLRERLRKHITDSGFLDVGVERIVDQVVNPKIGTVFQPKIEDIVYKYLGIPKPAKVEAFSILHQLPSFPINGNSLKIDTSHLLPNDLEQISPDSDKATIRSDCRDDSQRVEMESKTDDEDESPPFEPIENSGATLYEKNHISTRNMAADDVEREENKEEQRTYLDIATQDASSVSQKTADHEYDHNLGIFQESHSQLSHVSSNSCLSLETHDIHNEFNIKSNDNAVNISEEAQMPRFNENSNEENSSKGYKKAELHFDIKQDEIKFEGTKRNLDLQLPEVASQMCESANRNEQRSGEASKELSNVVILEDKSNKSSDHSFKFTKICVEGAQESAKETTLHPSPDDSVTAHLCIVDKSDNTQLSTARPNTSLTQKSDDKEKRSLESHKEVAVSNSGSNLADKIEETSCGPNSSMTVSSSTSRHKKHSKMKSSKERHRDKDRSKDKEIIRAKETAAHRSRSKSRHSQKKSSSHRVTSNGTSTSELKSKSSKHSKRRDESKRSRHYDKRHHSSSSSRQRDEKKKQSENKGDDHYASKDKIFWRKSTDSNDEDKDSENIGGKSKRSDNEKSGAIEKSKSKIENKKIMSSSGSNTIRGLEGSKQQTQLLSNDHENVPSKIVILNEVLENPTTNFIELGVASQECCINIVRSQDKKNIQSDQDNSENELHYFEEHSDDQFRHRLKLIDYTIDTYRKVLNSLRYDSLSPPIADFPKTHSVDMATLPAPYLIPTANLETQATLHIDCIEYTKTSRRQQDFDEQPESKRLKYRQNQTKLASPASSEASVNSKENEFISTDVTGADGDCTKKSISLVERSSAALTKLSQQRYTNDDLYKPRLCLGQRSRRRAHLDAVI